MTQPLALVLYENILPGTQLVNRLQDLNYRVQAVTNAEMLVASAEAQKPMLVLADLASARQDICIVIAQLRQNPGTCHIPVIAFGAETLQQAALAAGAVLATSESAVLSHLPALLQQALHVE